MEGELSRSRLLFSVEKVNCNGTTVIKVFFFCIMDRKPIITCKCTNLYMLLVFYVHVRTRCLTGSSFNVEHVYNYDLF